MRGIGFRLFAHQPPPSHAPPAARVRHEPRAAFFEMPDQCILPSAPETHTAAGRRRKHVEPQGLCVDLRQHEAFDKPGPVLLHQIEDAGIPMIGGRMEHAEAWMKPHVAHDGAGGQVSLGRTESPSRCCNAHPGNGRCHDEGRCPANDPEET